MSKVVKYLMEEIKLFTITNETIYFPHEFNKVSYVKFQLSAEKQDVASKIN
jgi:hypothetical protein